MEELYKMIEDKIHASGYEGQKRKYFNYFIFVYNI